MNKLNNKKGISLIVLVITIIVMIILAAAIILSLSSNGIIGKANNAKSDTNNSQLTEAASLHLAEYDLLSKTGDSSVAGKDSQTYVREKLVTNGFTEEEAEKVSVVDGGIVIADGSSKSLAERMQELNVPVGATVSGYTLTEKEYSTSGEENNGTVQELKTITTLTWKYAGTDADGDVIIVADIPAELPTDMIMTLVGKKGAEVGPTEMNNACDALYSVTGRGKGRAMTQQDVETITENGVPDFIKFECNSDLVADSGTCWLASNHIFYHEEWEINFWEIYQLTSGGEIEAFALWADGDSEDGSGYTLPFRPVVELDKSVQVSYADGVLTIN